MTAKVLYHGDLRTEAIHVASGSTIETDAPTDNEGRGERFSPTDLVAAAVASCLCTVMGIVARRHGIALEGTTCTVEKIMASSPRRIGAVRVEIYFPAAASYTPEHRALLERTARSCPVIESLHPDLQKDLLFHWPVAADHG